jgi:hypothetical protein
MSSRQSQATVDVVYTSLLLWNNTNTSPGRVENMADEQQALEIPDWPAELADPVAKLGPPSAIHRIPRQFVSRKFISGLALVIGGGIANYLYWFVFNAPDIQIMHLFLIGPILTGFALWYAVWRDRGLWVLIYPMGVLRWQRGVVVTFPWDEIEQLHFHRVFECERPRRSKDENGQTVTSWLPIVKSGSRTLGAHLALRRNDGAEAILPSSLGEFSRLCRTVQEETFRTIWPRVWSSFVAGNRIGFGDISVSLDGVHRDSSFLAWHLLDDVQTQNGKLILRAVEKRRPWVELPLQNVSNPHVFVALLIVGPPRVPEVGRA